MIFETELYQARFGRKDDYVVNSRVSEIAEKVAQLRDVQRINCFGCIEDEFKRNKALEEYVQGMACGETKLFVFGGDSRNLLSPSFSSLVKCQ